MTCRITSTQPVTTPKPVAAKAAEPALTPAQHIPVAFACGGMGQDSYVGGAGAAIARAVPLPTADASIISHNGGNLISNNGGNLISNSGGTLLPDEGASLAGGGAGGGKMVIVQPTQPTASLLTTERPPMVTLCRVFTALSVLGACTSPVLAGSCLSAGASLAIKGLHDTTARLPASSSKGRRRMWLPGR